MIGKFIGIMESHFDLVMIAEHMEESLVHLQHLLCWTLDDIVIFQHNVRSIRSFGDLSIILKEKIRSFNNVDEILYKYFNDKLTHRTEAFGKVEMEKQIMSLQHAIKSMYDQCVKKLIPTEDLKPSKFTWHRYQHLTFKQNNNIDKRCHHLITSELMRKELLKGKQKLSMSLFKSFTNNTNSKV